MTLPGLTHVLLEGPFLPLAALIWPLVLGLLAALPRLRAHVMMALPLAPIPALILALSGAVSGQTRAPDLLLGVALGLDAEGALLLGAIGALWLLAGIHALGYMKRPDRPAVFVGFWCLTLAGNLGVVLAQDVVTFYVAFAAVSLAAYFLVVHEGTDEALAAGKVYIVLAVIGEALLLAGLMVGASSADSLLIADVRAVLGADGWNGLALTAIVLAMGIKAGLVPLHIWLPLAHPAAPTPASAVLSGAIVKAGIIGLLRFVPGDAEVMGWTLVVLGLFGAYGGVIVGLGQKRIKAVLAYSTVSQMGVVIALCGAGVVTGQTALAYSAAALYCAHHALAKGALFLAVGVAHGSSARLIPFVVIATGVVAASVAGAPLAGGAIAKSVIKPAFEGIPLLLVTLSAIGTTALLARFIVMLGRSHSAMSNAEPGLAMAGAWLAASVGALVLPWLVGGAFMANEASYYLAPGALWSSLWPVGVGLAGFALVLKFVRLRIWFAEGDIAPWVVAGARRGAHVIAHRRRLAPPSLPGVSSAPLRRLVSRIEAGLALPVMAGLAMMAMIAAIVLFR
ncbi:complex I subunit 5 family protein [Pelagibacterium montanilacus]|uniref:complex I subunit 5 family protein n=1 Tax=Pelagibacterium montanilacus TaxID=2185280 RepID=UPI000F8E1D1C|nr:complex I subunit 5 family protein [Pelagibacterium montanilacus]